MSFLRQGSSQVCRDLCAFEYFFQRRLSFSVFNLEFSFSFLVSASPLFFLFFFSPRFMNALIDGRNPAPGRGYSCTQAGLRRLALSQQSRSLWTHKTCKAAFIHWPGAAGGTGVPPALPSGPRGASRDAWGDGGEKRDLHPWVPPFSRLSRLTASVRPACHGVAVCPSTCSDGFVAHSCSSCLLLCPPRIFWGCFVLFFLIKSS